MFYTSLNSRKWAGKAPGVKAKFYFEKQYLNPECLWPLSWTSSAQEWEVQKKRVWPLPPAIRDLVERAIGASRPGNCWRAVMTELHSYTKCILGWFSWSLWYSWGMDEIILQNQISMNGDINDNSSYSLNVCSIERFQVFHKNSGIQFFFH